MLTNYMKRIIEEEKSLRELSEYDFREYNHERITKERRYEIGKMRLVKRSKGIQKILRNFG